MVSVDSVSSRKPPLGAALAEGVKALSADQTLTFYLYRRYVFPLDGLVYWIKVTGTLAEIQPFPAIATQTVNANESIQIAPGNLSAALILSGRVTNPLSAVDQGLAVAEPLYISIAGPASTSETVTTAELLPGESFDVPQDPQNGVWVTSATGGHMFTAVFWTTPWAGIGPLPGSVTVKGSLHYSSMIEQEEDATFDTNEVVFTSLTEIQPFNDLGPNQLYACNYRNIFFAFSSRGLLYEQADLYHYAGRALRSKHNTQIINNPEDFNPQLVISNSLPLWLALPGYIPPYPGGFQCPIALYPSYLVTDNLPPPFGAVHVDSTESLVAAPTYDQYWNQDQLSKDRVRITLYGLDNLTVQTFLTFIEQVSIDQGEIGIMNMPIVRDEKLTQPEFKILAQKKIIEFDISYLQSAARNKARQLIEEAQVQILVADVTVMPVSARSSA